MKRLVAVFVCLALSMSGVALAQKKDDAYLVSKRDFRKVYKVVAIAPVDSEPYLNMPDSVARVLEEEVTARLQKRGYTVIPSTVLAGIRETMERQVGGTTDAETGRVEYAKLQAVREHAFRELWFRETFDAVVTIKVGIYSAPAESDRVAWDGVKQRIAYEGRSKKYGATISVSSVSVAFYDSTDKPLYLFFGGLEPLMYRDGEQLQPLDPAKLFLDEKKIRKAAQVAVSPI